MTKQERLSNGKKTVSSTNGVGKPGQQHAKEWNWITFLYHTQKSKFKMDERPKCDIGHHQDPGGDQP